MRENPDSSSSGALLEPVPGSRASRGSVSRAL